MGLVLAPATEAIMSVVPREKAGAGAAVNNSVRQVGGALGVAILGSVMASAYAGRLGNAVDGLPAGARDEAGESIVATLGAVQQAQGGDAEVARSAAAVVGPAQEAFVGAMHLTALGTAAAALVATTVVLIWMPGRERTRARTPMGVPAADPATGPAGRRGAERAGRPSGQPAVPDHQ
jgi:hypothetical protein